MTFTELLGQCVWAGTLVLLVAFGADRLLRGAPAAWRHFLWTATLAGLIALPGVVKVTPKWGLETPAPPAAAAETAVVTADAAVTMKPAPSAWNPMFAAWLTGCGLTAGWFLIGRLRVRRMVHRATNAAYARDLMDAAGGRGLRVLESAAAPTAMAAGVWRPVVLLPADAAEWPTERLRAALLHELMHVRRRDLAAQAIAQAACCVYWFHPLTWMAALRLRREREQACDDAVLGRGMAAQEYAGHLVALVRVLRGKRAAAMTMAEPSELESRVRALLDTGRDRRPLNHSAALAMVVALAVVLMPVAILTVRAQAAVPLRTTEVVAAADDPEPQDPAPVVDTGTLSGTVMDPSGARIPGCQIIARNADTSKEEVTRSDAAGLFSFPGIPAGHYQLEVRAAGFKIFRRVGLTVDATKTSTVNAFLTIGGVSEAVTVSAARPANVPAAAAPARSQRIRVGGNVQAASLLYKVAPVYPDDMKAKGVTGTVHLSAIIGKQGFLTEVHPLGGPEGLVAAAVEAVSHWLYQPSLLNGEPVAVETDIDIVFELK